MPSNSLFALLMDENSTLSEPLGFCGTQTFHPTSHSEQGRGLAHQTTRLTTPPHRCHPTSLILST